MGRPHSNSGPRRALVAATHSVAARAGTAKELEVLSAKGLLLVMESARWVAERAGAAEMGSVVPAASSAELRGFVRACQTQPPGQLPTLMRPLTNL